MGIDTKIEWTQATWNPIRGCTRVSEGCRNCYAEAIAGRFSGPGQAYHRLAKMTSLGARWTGRVDLIERRLFDPINWKEPRRIFVNPTSDLYHGKLEEEDIAAVFAVMARADWHTYQILTKRPGRMLSFLSDIQAREKIARKIRGLFGVNSTSAAARVATWPLPRVWQGISIEDQDTADSRIPFLLLAPAAVRWISAEPLLGPIDLRAALALANGSVKIDWLVCGGESGRRARPMKAEWARSLRDQCQAAGIKFFFKQWGEYLPPMTSGSPDVVPQHLNCSDDPVRVGKKNAGRTLDAREWNEYPAA